VLILDQPSINFSTEGRRDELNNSCQENTGSEQVVAFTVETLSVVTLDTRGSSFDTLLSLRGNCEDQTTELFCEDDTLGLQEWSAFVGDAGREYFAVVDGYNGASGQAQLNINEQEVPAACLEGYFLYSLFEILEERNLLDRGSTSGLPDNLGGSCGGSGSPEQILAFISPVNTRIFASTSGSDFDTVLYALADCDLEQEVACNDDYGLFTGRSEIEFPVQAGVVYYLVIDGNQGSQGDYILEIQEI